VLDNVWERIVKCAQAGALATETRMEAELVNSVYNVLPNEPLARVFHKHMRALGGVKYTPEERAFAETLRKSFPAEGNLGSEEIILPFSTERSGGGSTDVGDVSWAVPTAQFRIATAVPGTPGHSWQNVACSGSTIGRKGMVIAAKVLALSTADLFTTPQLLIEARRDFDRRRGGHEYRSRVPADQKPPLKYRDNPE
jgi:aminobenzoyl-glutamate utilization protein B